MTVADWCPTCQERTGLTASGVCQWCDSKLTVKRGGWKRPDLVSRLTDEHLRALYVLYSRDQVSINRLAGRVYQRLGYKNARVCASAISKGWQRLGLPVRSQREAARIANVRHGMAPKHHTPEQERAYRKWLRSKKPRCEAAKQQAPGAGRRCKRTATAGSRFCFAHDPGRANERQSNIAAMLARKQPVEMVPLAPFSAWLNDRVKEHGSLRAVHRLTGGDYTALARYRKGLSTDNQPKTMIAADTVRRRLQAAGWNMEDVYPDLRRSA